MSTDIQYIAEIAKLEYETVDSVIRLLRNDNSVPFIARYRRHETGNLDAQKIRLIQELLEQVKAVESRKESVIKSIGEKITPDVRQSLADARTLVEIEDIYAPFKPGAKGTLANRARQLGLDKAVELIFKSPYITNLKAFVQPMTKGLSTEKEVKTGVQHIIAEQISKEKISCDLLKSLFENSHITLKTEVKKEFKDETKYKDYHNKILSVKQVKSHQILAINRAQGGKILQVKMECPQQVKSKFLNEVKKQRKFVSTKSSNFVQDVISQSVEQSYERLMLPKLTRRKKSQLTELAERESIHVFKQNLRCLLLTPPVSCCNILAIDPGFKHGCKIAVIDKNGNILDTAVLDLTGRHAKDSENRLQGLLLTHNCNTIALGNGKGCRETENFITQMKNTGKLKKDVVYSIVDENGASIYSVSDEAQKEMPNLDVNLRSAVSIARRLQNPMSELIKIDPRHIGVGMYQHDMPEKMLQQGLNGVLEDCVSLVGVDLNASGVHALKRIAGLSERKAEEIVTWRQRNGSFRSREQLKEVNGIGEKTFQQCAGFLRIYQPPSESIILDTDDDEPVKGEKEKLTGKRKAEESGGKRTKKRKNTPSLTAFNKLDSTSIHPESYAIAEKLVSLTKTKMEDIGQSQMKQAVDRFINDKGFSTVCTMLECNSETLRLIIEGLSQTIGYDIRADFSKPLFRQGIISINDLKDNTPLTGRVTNVTTFGAFVDIGVSHNGLLHTSAIPSYKKLGVGDIVNVVCSKVDKKSNRIQLRLRYV